MKVIQRLKRAKELLEKGWCQGDLARTKDGVLTDVYSPGAEAFCLLGACMRAEWEADSTGITWVGIDELVTYEVEDRGYAELASYNDRPERTKEDVLEWLGRTGRRVCPDQVPRAYGVRAGVRFCFHGG